MEPAKPKGWTKKGAAQVSNAQGVEEEDDYPQETEEEDESSDEDDDDDGRVRARDDITDPINDWMTSAPVLDVTPDVT
ncbi:hypothetical protein DXG03_002808, partial [Asterophora parasitica]